MTAPRRVLMTADTIGGVWTYALELAGALAGGGTRVLLATMGRPLSSWQRAAAAGIEELSVCESDHRLEWMDDPWEDVACAGRWLLELEAEFEPDIVHLNGYAHGSLPWRSPVVIAGHSCVLSWWRAVKGESAPAAWNRYRQQVKYGLACADLVVAPSGHMLAVLNRHYGPLRRACVIPNGRDVTAFAPREKAPYLFSAGRLWDDAKNVGSLEEVAPGLPWPLYVAGDATHPNGLSCAYQHVRALGVLPPAELAAWLEYASIFVLPARYEPFGQSALEAAMAGCALVLGDIPSLRELWDEAAVFVPPEDTEALRRALQELIADDERRSRLGRAALTRSREYSLERMSSRYAEAYRMLMSQPVPA